MNALRLPLLSLVLVTTLAAQCPCAADLPGNFVKVTIANGTLEGRVGQDGVRSFKGIPFAAPPIGALRWREPQPVANWTGVRSAKEFGPRPNQPFLWKDMIFRSPSMGEDCLYLNVWTRAKSPTAGQPVLVYFHGGGLVAGDGSEPRYDGASTARKGVIVVTVNYRLGIFGFFSHPELTAESPHHASGNYGHLDQVAALRWVQQNIAAFGGDPRRVTIAGQSAGSSSVSALMASPLAKGLFQGAVGESGSILGDPEHVTLAQAEAEGTAFGAKAHAPTLAALRAIPEAQLLELGRKVSLARRALVDGYFFTESPDEVFFTGRQADVPLLAGWNAAEMSPSQVLGKEAAAPEHFVAAVKALYGAHAGEVLTLYPAATPDEVRQANTELATDRSIGYRTWKWTDTHAKSGGKPVFRYLYSQPLPHERGTAGAAPAGGPPHSAEIPYIMGNLALIDAYEWTPDDFRTSETFQAYLVNFIKTGNPNGTGLPPWTWMQGSLPHVMVIAAESHLIPEPHLDRYTLMETLETAEK